MELHGSIRDIDAKAESFLYENEEFKLDTHYYGGIKYQWAYWHCPSWSDCKERWNSLKVSIGGKEDDPVFVITDLLIHLAAKTDEKSVHKLLKEKNWTC